MPSLLLKGVPNTVQSSMQCQFIYKYELTMDSSLYYQSLLRKDYYKASKPKTVAIALTD